ncbi:hypothetical protein Pst134EA_027093 [Puccinia striiformis f. sp. tritici]|uniref:hypothetical protein n=1 Tax=Puccinia striiformis f. sp. tritici TaxID=168172 RepID=UPI0020086EC9|nr:hypothetical protein Pst134EA_027093 [Puccinia striiformis f. sp. tritici]KAH9450390.1 hypothetical protein Pst134EA_027093 [Puccinia striiformis f. sp. tritici]
MKVLFKRVVFCVVLHEISLGRLVLSSLTTDAHATRSSLESRRAVDLGGPEESIKEGQTAKEVDVFPVGRAERQGAVEPMRIDREEIKARIELFKPPPGTDLSVVKTELEQLHQAFRIPTLHRVFRLYGLNPTIRCLLPKSDPHDHLNIPALEDALSSEILSLVWDHEAHDEQMPIKKKEFTTLPLVPRPVKSSTIGHADHHTTTTGDGQQLVGESKTGQSSQSGINVVKDGHDPGSSRQELLMNLILPKLSGIENSHGKQASGNSEESISHPRGDSVKAVPIESGILEGDPLTLVEDFIAKDNSKAQIDLWNSLQAKLLSLQSPRVSPSYKDRAVLSLGFIQSMYLMGDYIINYRMMDTEFIKEMQIFKPDYLVKMVELHIEFQFLRLGDRFFDSPESIIPTLGFLKNGPAVFHFHRSIEALSAEDQTHVVYGALKTIWLHAGAVFPLEAITHLRIGFLRRMKFIEEADSLSSTLKGAGGEGGNAIEIEHLLIVEILDKLAYFFHNPPMSSYLQTTRIEFQLVFFVLIFIDLHYPLIMETIKRRMEDPIQFEKKLKFMTDWIKFYRNRNQDPSDESDKSTAFFGIARWAKKHDPMLAKWINDVTSIVFKHDRWESGSPTLQPQQFNIWMGKS